MVASSVRSDRTAWSVAFGLVALAVGAAAILRGELSVVLGQIPWFLHTYAAIIGPCELLAAVLLAWRAVVLRTRRSALLAAAYACSTPLVFENLASLPGVLGPHGALTHQTPPWCWLVWHLAWATLAVLFAWMPDAPVRRPLAIVGAGFGLALAFALIAMHADVWLPAVLGPGDTNTLLLLTLGWSTVALLVIAAVGLGVVRDSSLDAFVLVAVVALALDEVFVLTTAVRFSLGTYLARTLGAINAVTVLIAVGVEFGRLIHEERGSLSDRVARAAAVRREQALRHVAQTIPQLVWIASPDGQIQWYNARWFEYTGQTPGAAESLDWLSVQHPDDAALAQQWRTAIRTGDPLAVESRLRAADGTYRWFLSRFEPMRDATKQVIKWYGSATDIELRRQRDARSG